MAGACNQPAFKNKRKPYGNPFTRYRTSLPCLPQQRKAYRRRFSVGAGYTRLFAFNPESLGFNPELPGFTTELSDFNPELSGVNPRLSGVNPELPDVNPRLSDVNPEPSDVNPELPD